MEKSKYIHENKIIMKPMPHFDHIILHKDYKYEYLMYPITKYRLDKIKQDFLANNTWFDVNIENYIVRSDDIIIFGKSNENPIKIENELSRLIVSKGGALTVPSIIDKDNLLQSNKITTGVSAHRVFEHKLCLIGNPANVIIFRNLLPIKIESYE